MIQFPCPCGFVFHVQDEMAGNLIQCPKCARLNDVPTLSDLAGLSDDGTIKLSPDTGATPAARRSQADLQRAYMRYDSAGEAIDHRATPQELAKAGVEEIPLADAPPSKSKPKYDPVTGELVRPMEMTPLPAPPQDVPFAQPAAAYADAENQAPGLGYILMSLFAPVNVFVMTCVFMVHLFLQVTLLVSGIMFFITLPVIAVIVWMLLAHYGTIVDETGPEACDELPRPLRQMDWHDDLWGPMSNVVLALLWCYVVPLALLRLDVPLGARLALTGGGLVLGTFVFPALMLTTTTSGTILNIAPSRIWGTIRTCGASYLLAVALWIVTAGAYTIGILGTLISLLAMFTAELPRWMTIAFHWAITAPLLLTGIYLAHAFCWYLGMLYRRHHEQFPWVLQRHHYRNATAAPPPRKKQGLASAQLPSTMDEAERRRRLAAMQPNTPATPTPPRPVQPLDYRGGKVRRSAS